jgi:hypothetical protein
LGDGIGRHSLLFTFRSVPFAFLCAILLITLGLFGLLVRYGEAAGTIAKIALGIGIVGGAAGVISHLLWTTGLENGRALMNNSMAVMFAGLFFFGLIALRTRPMPRGNGLPALAGFWWPFVLIRATIYHQLGQWLNVPLWLSFTWFAIMGFFLAWLGYVLQSDASPGEAVTMEGVTS